MTVEEYRIWESKQTIKASRRKMTPWEQQCDKVLQLHAAVDAQFRGFIDPENLEMARQIRQMINICNA